MHVESEHKAGGAIAALGRVLPAGSRVNAAGRLEIGGCDLVEVAERFGTPSYVFAEDDMRARARRYLDAFASTTDDFEVIFASKALPVTAVYAAMASEGLSVDVASGGELHLALRGGFDPARIFMHGNNKTDAELEYALESGVGHIVVDSFDEIDGLERILGGDRAGRASPQPVLIRVTPGVKPSTHTYVQTGQVDSKFGFGIEDGLARRAVDRVLASESLALAGLHAHIGSQIFALDSYRRAISLVADFIGGIPGFDCRLLNVGGGLGIAYTREDEPASIDEYVELKTRAVRSALGPEPRILIEPGRSLVGNAGVTIYTVGTIKRLPGVRTYVAVDGGMSDNLRPMLYQSRYEALLANRMNDAADDVVTIAGQHCESGDILVEHAHLPAPRAGDILVTPATGAYGHSMANNYNGATRPPVIFCRQGQARTVVRRETYDDLSSRDVE